MSTYIVLYPAKVSVQYEVKKKKGREEERKERRKEEREGKETTSQNEQGKKHSQKSREFLYILSWEMF